MTVSGPRIFVEDARYPERVTHPVGYAEVQRQILLGLDALGTRVGLPECAAALRASTLIPAETRDRLLALQRTPFEDGPDVLHLQVASPDGFAPRPGRCNVGLTMTEREQLQGQGAFDWSASCNRMHAIVTPTEWNRVVFERHGIRNVHVCPLGVDSAFFQPRPVRFLAVCAGFGWPGSRANWEDVLDTFREAFRGQDDVTLTVLSLEARRPFEFGGLGHALRQLPLDLADLLARRLERGLPRVEVRPAGGLTQDDVRALYQQHDCLVSYSREGWGLPLLEALACSLELIACDYGAPMAFLAGSPARLFHAGRLRADNLRFEGGDLAMLRAHLRAVYEARRASRRWAERLAWAPAIARLRDLLHTLHADWTHRAGTHP